MQLWLWEPTASVPCECQGMVPPPPPPRSMPLFDDERACAQGRSGKTSYQRYHTCVISLIRCFANVEV